MEILKTKKSSLEDIKCIEKTEQHLAMEFFLQSKMSLTAKTSQNKTQIVNLFGQS